MKDVYTILQSKPHNLHYLNRYWKFIQYYQENPTTSNEYLEEHHICPKAKDLFPEYKNLSKYPWNKIKLTIRQHIIAHYMLMKAYSTFSMMCSIQRTAGQYWQEGRYCQRLITIARREVTLKRSQMMFFTNTETGICQMFENDPGSGWVRGQNTRSEDQCKRIQNSQLGVAKGKMFWNNGKEHKRSKECPGDGWVLGLLEKEKIRRNQTVNPIGQHWWNNGIENKKQVECPGEGWIRGKSPATREKCKLSHLGNSGPKGMFWWNDNNREIRSKTQPGIEWKRGRLPK